MATPNTNFDEIIVTTLKNRRRQLADNVLEHNALLRRLNQRGNVDLADGGETLVEELEFTENSTFKYYQGYEVLDISPSEVFTAAEYDWKQAAVTVSISGLERRKNSGRERTIRLLERRISNAEKTMTNNLASAVYSDGTNSKQPGGLQLLVANDPSTGTVGGINRANFAFWRNQVRDVSSAVTSSLQSGNVQSLMTRVWIDCVRGTDRPDTIVADAIYYRTFQESLQAIQRITSEEDAGSGFRSLTFYGTGGSAQVFYDDKCPASTMYFLNTSYLFWRPHRDANMSVLDRRQSINQDATVVPIIWMGNMTMSNAARQGVLIA